MPVNALRLQARLRPIREVPINYKVERAADILNLSPGRTYFADCRQTVKRLIVPTLFLRR